MNGNSEKPKRSIKWVHVKATPDEHTTWTRLAAEAGLSLADLIRTRLSPGADPIKPKKRAARRADPALVAEIGRIGSNLNQLARWANSYKSAADSVEMLAALTAIERQVSLLVGSKKSAGESDDAD